MKAHYVCIGGCGLVSDTMIKCDSVGCWRGRNPLAECLCKDNKHTEFFKMYSPSGAENVEKNSPLQKS